jgi:hypothetical protein
MCDGAFTVKLFASSSTVLVVSLAAAGSAFTQAKLPVNPDAQVLADFKARVDKYVELRKKADDSAPPLKKTDDAREIKDAQQALVERVGAARSTAKQGDIFTPDITAFFKRVLRPEAKEKDAKTMMKDDKPPAGTVTFKINGPYPDKQPLASSPPEMLAKLPPLPKDIDYRFVDKHLILRDSRANTIIDFIPNAIP